MRRNPAVIFIGIDDTDTPESEGTNQLARRIATALPPGFALTAILRHQLLVDPRIPYTSKNGSASIGVRAEPGRGISELVPVLRREMRAWYKPGSDPGLCIAEHVPPVVIAFGRRCQREPVPQREARELALTHAIHLEGLGGTEDGVIGALAAVGLFAGGEDGRVVHLPGWTWPDPFGGPQPVEVIRARGVDEVRERDSDAPVERGLVDVGKHLRPSYRRGRIVLFVERPAASRPGEGGVAWRALKLP